MKTSKEKNNVKIRVDFTKTQKTRNEQQKIIAQLATRLRQYYQSVTVKGNMLLVEALATWSTVYGRAKDIMMGLCFHAEVTVNLAA
ncbi:MAG: hypothetical protein RLZZ234_895 [Candidatus Parcubacteria bacterium]|jgi:hypothetical protein